MKKSMALVSLLILYSLTSCSSFPVHEELISSPDIPPAFDGYRILFLSDLHINSLRSDSYYDRAIEKALERDPDIILLGGDYVDKDTGDISAALQRLAPFSAIPVYYVLGNHDNWEDPSGITEQMNSMGFTELTNQNKVLSHDGNQIIIAGFADLYSDTIRKELSLSGVIPEDFCILLSHSPEPYTYITQEDRVDLMLSGHTHGGQVTFLGLWAPIMPLRDKSYWRGRYDSEGNSLIISNGIGFYKMGVRIFARPGMEEILLQREPSEK